MHIKISWRGAFIWKVFDKWLWRRDFISSECFSGHYNSIDEPDICKFVLSITTRSFGAGLLSGTLCICGEVVSASGIVKT